MNDRPNNSPLTAICICCTFLLLASWFVWGDSELDIPKTTPIKIAKEDISTKGRRSILTDPPTIKLAGFERTCMDCHILPIPTGFRDPKELLQHQHIHLSHGIHEGCVGCHDEKDRDKLSIRGKKSIGYDDVVSLCSDCHRQVAGDWERGSHGRSNGYWDTTQGERVKLKCTECHDPHRPQHPAMDPMKPLPGPNTLRMPKAKHQDDEHSDGHTENSHIKDPLRKAAVRALRHQMKKDNEQKNSKPRGH